ncbi:hypothetical protein IP90_00238 [Luteimonas cucumeris]|uniref:Uncharacterized protein n=1 Tax=Luteimonas cucumeris TaxID=985012 RepID=A0A562LEI5_9GAMM|nr:hypothetical protein [Luteimonas cucumeris]TWI05976.1 hypothetical protein IP90_00238 [Luteimonas cucumeris]
MGQIYGVNTQTYFRLPEEDRQAIRQSYQAQAQPQADNDDAPTVTLAATTPVEATTPQQAVQAIHAMPVPDNSDLAGMPSYAASSVYESRAQTYNQTRLDAAQAALDRLAPQRSDYDSLNGATASYEYGQATQYFDSNLYVQELRRIVDEAGTQPNSIPTYLTDTPPSADPQSVPLPQMQGALALLGVELPANATPDQIAAGYQILATVPDDMLGTLINPGSQVTYNTGAGGISTPSFIPVRGEAGVTVEGKVELSDVQTGVNFEQTQQFRMSVQTQGEAGIDFGRTPIGTLYKWADRLGQLPESVRALSDSSPVLSRIVRGLPVSGSYHEFSGARLTYEAVVTPQQGAQLADGELEAAPNPLAPLDMPTGTSVLIRGQSLEGSTWEASYKAFTAGGTHTELDGLGFGVRRLEGSMVEVYAGPVQTVENEMFLGLGRQGTAAIGIASEYKSETQDMSIARIDLSTSEGQAAYQQFMSSGRVPDWTPPGVPQAGTTSIYTGEHASFIGVQLGGLEIGGSSDSQLTVTRTTWQDGSIEQRNTYALGDNHVSDVSFSIGADGKPIDAQTQWRVVLGNYDPALTSYLSDAYNGDASQPSSYGSFDGGQHVQLSFSSAELMQLRDQARDSVRELQGQDKLDAIDRDPVVAFGMEESLAAATTSEEVYRVVSNDFYQSQMAESLLGMSLQTGRGVPGQIAIRDAG